MNRRPRSLSWLRVWLACRRSWVRLRPGQHSRSYLRRKCCFCNYSCNWLDFQVFWNKDYKPYVPSHNTSMPIQSLWDVKDPKHLSRRVWRGVPGVVVWPKKGWYTSHKSWSPVRISPGTSVQKLGKTNQQSKFYMTTAVITALNKRSFACSLDCNNRPHFKKTKRETHSLYSTLFALRGKLRGKKHLQHLMQMSRGIYFIPHHFFSLRPEILYCPKWILVARMTLFVCSE